MADLRNKIKDYEKVMESFSEGLECIAIYKDGNDKNPEVYRKKEDISREFIKRCTNSKVFETLVLGKGLDVVEVLSNKQMVFYRKKAGDYSKVSVVMGDKVMEA